MRLLTILIILCSSSAFAGNPFLAPDSTEVAQSETEAVSQCNNSINQDPVSAGLSGEDGSSSLLDSVWGKANDGKDYSDTEKYRLVGDVNGVEIYYDIANKNYIEKK